MSNACWPEDDPLPATAVAEALIAIEQELDKLEQQDQQLLARRMHLHRKMCICHSSLTQLLLKTDTKYEAKDWPKFPELNHKDEE